MRSVSIFTNEHILYTEKVVPNRGKGVSEYESGSGIVPAHNQSNILIGQFEAFVCGSETPIIPFGYFAFKDLHQRLPRDYQLFLHLWQIVGNDYSAETLRH